MDIFLKMRTRRRNKLYFLPFVAVAVILSVLTALNMHELVRLGELYAVGTSNEGINIDLVHYLFSSQTSTKHVGISPSLADKEAVLSFRGENATPRFQSIVYKLANRVEPVTSRDVRFNRNFTNFDLARRSRRDFAKTLFGFYDTDDALVCDDVTFALAKINIDDGTSIAHANQLMRVVLSQILDGSTRDTLESRGEFRAPAWYMRSWIRIYYMNSSRSRFSQAGRLEMDVEKMIEKLFYWFAWQRSVTEITKLENIWFIEDWSENKDIMMKMNCYLAVQVLKYLPEYRDTPMKDGFLPREHVKAWDKYYEHFAFERARLGLFVELGSPAYGGFIMGEIFNVHDFSESDNVRRAFRMLLDTIWADNAIDQFEGYRAGPKSRVYPHFAYDSRDDSYSRLARELLGVEQQLIHHFEMQSHLILHLTNYSLPDVIMDIFLNREDSEPFVYLSSRPASREDKDEKPNGLDGNWMDATGGKILRYSYQTQSYNMGSWMIDTSQRYAHINSQNRFQGISFSSAPNARVIPMSKGLAQDGRTSYNAHITVQHRNAMLLRNNYVGKTQAGQIRVFFPDHTNGMLIEQDGWVIVKEGDAWLAVSMLRNGEKPGRKNYIFKKEDRTPEWAMEGYWMHPEGETGLNFVLFVAAQSRPHRGLVHYETVEEFLSYLNTAKLQVRKGHGTFSFVDDTGEQVVIEVGPRNKVPLVNRQEVNMEPKKVFDSPWLNSDHGSGIVTIAKGNRKIELDFRPHDGDSSYSDIAPK